MAQTKIPSSGLTPNLTLGNVTVTGTIKSDSFAFANGAPIVTSGAIGYTGSAGAGYTGSAGTNGYTGSASTTPGYTGSAGSIGYTGSSGTGGSGVTDILIASNTKPTSNLALGLQWLDTTSNVIYTYVSDGTSNAWIDTSSVSVGNIVSSGGSGTVGYTYSGTTTDATETEIFINGSAGSRYTVDADSTIGYDVNIVGRNSTGTGVAFIKLLGAIKNNGGNVADSGNLVETIVERTYSNWLVDARADNTNDSLNLYVQGSSGNTITWSATMTVTKAA